MGSMHTGLEDHFSNYSQLADYYCSRIKGGGPSLIVTGGISPNREGRLGECSGTLSHYGQLLPHKFLTHKVRKAGGRICMQILHAGRYGYHKDIVSCSSIKAPINCFTPRELETDEVEKQIDDYVKCAKLAEKAGYHGVEIMGSEGYFINQFLCKRTNKRRDCWGGSFENRKKLAIQIVSRIRNETKENFILIYRISVADLVEQGSEGKEIIDLAKSVEAQGVNLINCGIGWHESRIPTIASSVPVGAFSGAVRRVSMQVSVPVIATNRINTPEAAEKLLSQGICQLVSMARPFLADAQFVQKARENRSGEINVCIGCNQACLDQIFDGNKTSCVVNPRTLNRPMVRILRSRKNIAVIGAGPAGMAVAFKAALYGHEVLLFEGSDRIGGQFNLAKEIPGKKDYAHTIQYFHNQLGKLGVKIHLNTQVSHTNLSTIADSNFDHIVVATGANPRHCLLYTSPSPRDA